MKDHYEEAAFRPAAFLNMPAWIRGCVLPGPGKAGAVFHHEIDAADV
jgi:hypothetical protein